MAPPYRKGVFSNMGRSQIYIQCSTLIRHQHRHQRDHLGVKALKEGRICSRLCLTIQEETHPTPTFPAKTLAITIIIGINNKSSSSLHRSIVVCLRHLSNLVFIASWSRFSGLFLDILISMHWSNPRKRQLISRLFFIIEPFTATTPKDYMIEIQT